ncbi:hypothetical protein C8J25_101872 [Sphingomonas faeni]|uniref:Uncharacterized protein n=1 Tax=Sphingomonas faeni TaxID=185950 RepID=A0A2T5UD24_9SPHN|nr:hypothetical protein C8J25_101872 [Sphingomonas faeni]
MALVYPIPFPSQAPATQRLTLNRRQSATESPFTYAVQVVDTAAQWAFEWSWPIMSHVKAEALTGWLLSLKGQIGTFTYRPRQALTSGLTGRTLAIQGYASNDAISVAGWAANASSGLRAGQFFQLGKQLLRIVDANAGADANGRVTISFEPSLRANIAAATPVNFASPAGEFRLSISDGYGYTLDPNKLPDLGSFTAREVI